jgi:pimeloyl-ACP methyl ester carboxylesterase
MATYVLVHGGGHGGWCYQRVARLLRSAGHDVYAPTLTGLGERAHLLGPGIDLDTHITDVVQVLRYEDLREVILVGHSYGGMVVTGVADRALDRVGHLVYLDAATPANGQSLADLAPELMAASRASARTVDGVELVNFPGEGPMPHFGLTDPDDIAWLAPKITPHPWKCFAQPLRLTHEARLRALPQTQIVCTATLPFRAPADLEPARAAGRLWDIDAGHDLMIAEPEAVAGLLGRVATAGRPTPR